MDVNIFDETRMVVESDCRKPVIGKEADIGSIVTGCWSSLVMGYQISDQKNRIIEFARIGAHADEPIDASVKARFFEKLAQCGFFGLFRQLHESARQTPLADVWFDAASDQEYPAIRIEDDKARCRRRIFIENRLALRAAQPRAVFRHDPNQAAGAKRAIAFVFHQEFENTSYCVAFPVNASICA